MRTTITGRFLTQSMLAREVMLDMHRAMMRIPGVRHVPPDGYIVNCDTADIERRIMKWFKEGRKDMITRNTEWRTKDGRRWKPRVMRNDHLLNTIRVLEDRSPKRTTVYLTDERRAGWLRVLRSEVRRRRLQEK